MKQIDALSCWLTAIIPFCPICNWVTFCVQPANSSRLHGLWEELVLRLLMLKLPSQASGHSCHLPTTTLSHLPFVLLWQLSWCLKPQHSEIFRHTDSVFWDDRALIGTMAGASSYATLQRMKQNWWTVLYLALLGLLQCLSMFICFFNFPLSSSYRRGSGASAQNERWGESGSFQFEICSSFTHPLFRD